MRTLCACCQVCVKISSAPAVLMAALRIVTTAMVKRGQSGDVHWCFYPREITSVCVLLGVFKVFSPLPSFGFLRGGQWCKWRVNARLHTGGLVDSNTLFSLSCTGRTSLSRTDRQQGNGRACFNNCMTGAAWAEAV